MQCQLFYLVLTAVSQIKFASGMDCFSCLNITNLSDCWGTISCQADAICSSTYDMYHGQRLYTLGCRPIVSCPVTSTDSGGGAAGSIIGRSVETDGDQCSECCNTSNCNRQLCQHHEAYCSDDPAHDCAAIADTFNICYDIPHAKQYCRRFCGFCSTVDGGWAAWSAWSGCDVTCANGTRTRSRACTDPPPANGGNDCVGDATHRGVCVNPLCPVNGGWTRWSEWGSCSASCDIGLQRRSRTCSNPTPVRHGHSCHGDSRDDRVCTEAPCTNGGWSSWGTWGSCDKTCDGGVRTRTRNCDSPAPSLTGHYCTGVPIQAESCNFSPCQGPVVFYAKDLSTLSPGGNAALLFTKVTSNVGDAYNRDSGYFTAPVNGTYTFSVQFCTYHGQYAGVGLYVNDVRYQNMNSYAYYGHMCRTLSVSALLKEGDTVHVKTDGQTATGKVTFYASTYDINSFSGALMRLQ